MENLPKYHYYYFLNNYLMLPRHLFVKNLLFHINLWFYPKFLLNFQFALQNIYFLRLKLFEHNLYFYNFFLHLKLMKKV